MNDNTFWTIKELASQLRISLPTAYNLIKEPGFPVFVIPGTRRKLIIANDVIDYMMNRSNNKEFEGE